MTLSLLRRILWARRFFIILSAVGCCLVASATATLLPSYYLSSARVELEIIRSNSANGAAMSSEYARAYVATQAELIGDYAVAGRAADASGLLSSPQMAAQYQSSGASERMDFRRWVANLLASNTSVGLVQDSNILEIRYAAGSPELAAGLAELMRTAYIDETLATERARALQTAEWFAQSRLDLSKRLAAAEAAKTEFERENGLILLTDEATASEERLRTWASTPPRPRDSAAIVTPIRLRSAEALAEIQQRIAAASQTQGPNHPGMIALRQQEQLLREAAAQEQAAAQPQTADSAVSEEAVRQQQTRVLAESENAGELRRLAANVALLREQYAQASRRVADAQMQAESLDIGFSPLGPASRPIKPAFPNYRVVVGLSFGFGLMLGMLTALFLELLALRVRHTDDLEILGGNRLNVLQPPPRNPGGKTSGPRKVSRPDMPARSYAPAPVS